MTPVKIAIVNHKGGTGKTTTTVNLGVALARLDKKVLLIDLDAQGNLTYYFGIHQYRYEVSDVMMETASLADACIDREGLKVIPTGRELANLEISMISVENRELILKNALKNADEFDYVLIDCAPALSLLSINALCAADRVIIPLQLEVLSIQGLAGVMETIFSIKEHFNPGLAILGILPLMVDVRRSVTKELYEYIKENFGIKIFESVIGTDVKIVESPSFGQSVLSYAPDSAGAKAYTMLSNEIAELLQGKELFTLN